MSYELLDRNYKGLAVEHATSEVEIATADCPVPIVGKCTNFALSIGVLELPFVFTSLTVDAEEAYIATLLTYCIEA